MTASSLPALAPLSDQELDDLADFLDSDVVPEETMDISMLHGFLTALALSPSPAPLEEWLPTVWGEDLRQPEFTSPAQQHQIESLLECLSIQVKQGLSDSDFVPILYVDENDHLDIARPWCFGFTQGIWLQEEAWTALLDDEDSGALLEPIFDCSDDEAREALVADGENLAQWEHDIANALPDIVAEIQAFYQKRKLS
ncbi:UPF0149 family protein [Uliginosibacterium gangwonense]|uniref:UPF0149 family protein n=1 Tax=Uliginosibacterium gangwonense TaxID=392736 RepID=UPI00035EF400|nr:UPF0149 family protein [Uliginosibacterium gangwonense]